MNYSINYATHQELMAQRGKGNKSTMAKQVSINEYSQNPRMAINNKNDHNQKK